jgi:beta-mannanase
MKKYLYYILSISIIILSVSCEVKKSPKGKGCLIGAFISDKPTQKDIVNFKNNYGKKPYLVMSFVDWGNFIDQTVIKDIYAENCVLFITLEPWRANKKESIDYDGLLSGKYDKYIIEFAGRIKKIEQTVFLRFAHEMNGNWYPWSGTKIGKDKYIKIYRYIKDMFDRKGALNVKWVFSINWEDVPKENNYFLSYYPGDKYVDYVGIDGYNWGDSKKWSKWMSFNDIFGDRYAEIVKKIKKPVIVSEFGSTSKGGNKALWIKEAISDIKRMKRIRAFILFNIDKETDWRFPINRESGRELRRQLKDIYFKDKGEIL